MIGMIRKLQWTPASFSSRKHVRKVHRRMQYKSCVSCGRNIKGEAIQLNPEEDHVDAKRINCCVCEKMHSMEIQVKKRTSQSSHTSTHIVGWIVVVVCITVCFELWISAQFVKNLSWAVRMRVSTRVHMYRLPKPTVYFVQNLWNKE